jgi:glycosyltransferase involved in cell wall biosynthesis
MSPVAELPRRERAPVEPESTKGDAPLVSVVIPSYNSARTIRECLSGLSAQRTTVPFEIIVADSSDDGTEQIVSAHFPEVTLLHFDGRRSVGIARNIGIEKARGEIILFLDTDCVPNPEWIDQMVAGISNFAADGVGGSVENGTPWSISGTVGFYLEFFRFLGHAGKPSPTPFLMGGTSGFKRCVLEGTRYTDRSVGDDFIFGWQQTHLGRRLFFLPSVSVKHINKTGVRTMFRYQYKLGRGACAYRYLVSPGIVRVLKTVPVLVFGIPFAVMPWIGWAVLRTRGVLELLKFTALLPVVFAGNGAWALGFYRELMSRKSLRNSG